MLKWPNRRAVDAAVRAFGQRLAEAHPNLQRFGYFGSYARGAWGVGSDTDLVAIVDASTKPFAERPLQFDLSGLPVAAELIVYTHAEWAQLLAQPHDLAREIDAYAVWVFQRHPVAQG